MNRETLADYNGQLCILYEYTISDSPELARSFYSTGVNLRQFVSNYGDTKIGQTVRSLGNGTYQDEDGLKYRLIEGGATKPIYFDRIPVPAPKVRAGIPTRWRDGWQKYLKTQGWVAL